MILKTERDEIRRALEFMQADIYMTEEEYDRASEIGLQLLDELERMYAMNIHTEILSYEEIKELNEKDLDAKVASIVFGFRSSWWSVHQVNRKEYWEFVDSGKCGTAWMDVLRAPNEIMLPDDKGDSPIMLMDEPNVGWVSVPPYSTNDVYAIRVIKKMQERFGSIPGHFSRFSLSKYGWHAEFLQPACAGWTSESFPESICRAALMAICRARMDDRERDCLGVN